MFQGESHLLQQRWFAEDFKILENSCDVKCQPTKWVGLATSAQEHCKPSGEAQGQNPLKSRPNKSISKHLKYNNY